MTDQITTVQIDDKSIGVARDGENIVIFVQGMFSMTIDDASAAELGKAIYANATRMPAEEVELFFGRFSEPPVH